ncbi:MAG: SDR family NAD(P)-dependent oxidoreductase [Verrucomicrobiales bacterium]|nr:SDR family NAD(P)-dependent oxidoreductase [Verrucomicrobiales bacterium]
MNLSGKIAVVTGGGSGIGLGIAKALAAEGCRVVIAGRNGKKLEHAAATFPDNPPLVIACDISDRAAARELIEKTTAGLGPVDFLINSAGINIAKRKMIDLDPEDFDKVMAVNTTGFFNILHAVLPGMRERKDGLIFNVSSIAGKRALPLAGPAYAASKFATTALGTEIGTEEAENGIRITNIYPGEANTPLLDDRPVEVPADVKAKMVHPEDIGAMVVAIAQLPPHVVVPELIIKPLYQEYL